MNNSLFGKSKFKKIASVILTLAMSCGALPVVGFAQSDIQINDIQGNVVNITALTEQTASVVIASYLNEKLVNTQYIDTTLAAQTADYTLDGFNAGKCDTVRAFVWKDIATLEPLCDAYEEEIQTEFTGSVPVDGTLPDEGVLIQAGGSVSASVPKDVVLETNATELTLNVNTKSDTDSNLTIGENESLLALDVHIEGISESNTVGITVDLGPVLAPNLNSSAIKLYHIEDGATNKMTYVSNNEEFTAHNQFKYDPATGNVVIYVATFSEFALMSDDTNAWGGSEDTSWYDENETVYTVYNVEQLAGLGKLVRGYTETNEQTGETTTVAANSFDGKTIQLGADVKIFNTIEGKSGEEEYDRNGQWFLCMSNWDNPFSGTFDGMGHTISNLYQNGWDMAGLGGEEGYYDTHLGLFGYVNGATIQNLTVDNFYLIMELCDVGCIAGYAGGECTFKNISVFNSDGYSYNKRVAAIVGSNPSKDNSKDTVLKFENITVDNSNTFHSLWGTYDCATAGILGKLESESYANFKNVHASAKLDVYNDVCANYQYYWYRYCGMLIGTVARTKTENGYTQTDLSNITAEGCTVNFGNWNDYYYCELVANSLASYTHDHQFSRLVNADSVDVENKTVTIDGVTSPIPTEGRANYVVVTGDYGSTENATCYHFVDGEVWNHEDAGYETTDVDGDGEIDSGLMKEDRQHYYLPFNQVFGGKGWGVKGNQLSEFGVDGVKDITVGKEESVAKFTSLLADNSDVINNKVFKVSDFFGEVEGADIAADAVMVSITSVDTEEIVGTYTANAADWTQGTITFNRDFEGPVMLTIQDYQFCTPTTVTVNIIKVKALDETIGDCTEVAGSSRGVFSDNYIVTSGGKIAIKTPTETE